MTDAPRCMEDGEAGSLAWHAASGTGIRRLPEWRLLYPFVFALWPPLSFYAHNIDHFRLDALWLPLLVSLGAAAILQGLVLATVRQPSLAAFKTFGFLCLLFAGGRVCLARRGTPLPGTSMDVGVLVAGATAAARAPGVGGPAPARLRSAPRGARVVLPGAGGPAPLDDRRRRARPRPVHPSSGPPASSPPGRSRRFPTSSTWCSTATRAKTCCGTSYGHDNRPFLDALRSRGCYVASSAVANYPQTALSLASSLNLDYLDEWVAGLPPVRPTATSSPRPSVEAASSMPSARPATRSSRFERLRCGGGALGRPIRVPGGRRSALAFWRGFLASTPVPDLVTLPALAVAGEERHRRGVLYTFDRLGPLARSPGPLFVLAHVVAPHPPFVFDARGPAAARTPGQLHPRRRRSLARQQPEGPGGL